MSKTVRVFGVPMDLGQSRRGVDMGPSAVRYAGLHERLRRLGYETHDGGNIRVLQVEEAPKLVETTPNARHLAEVALVCDHIYQATLQTLGHDERVIFMGGDHSISIGTVSAVTHYWEVGLLWIDAHADMNTPQTTLSGNIHGMPLAVLLGDGPSELTHIGKSGAKVRPEQVALVGLRDLDTAEQKRMAQSGVAGYTMRHIDEQGMAAIVNQVLDRFAPYQHIHVSLDLDSLDPTIAPGVGTPVAGGLTYREAHLLMEILADSGKVRSMDIVEVNPILDERNRTAQLAVELTASLFGQRIL